MQILQHTIFKNQVNHIVQRNKKTLEINYIGEASPQRVNKILNVLRRSKEPITNNTLIIDSKTDPHELLKYSIMPFLQKIISDISIQYLDLSLQVNPLTMQEYKLPNGQQIVPFFKSLFNLKTFERIDKILGALKGEQQLHKKYMAQLLVKTFNKTKKIIDGMNFCISDDAVYSLLFIQNYYDTSILNSRQLTQQNNMMVKKKLLMLDSLYPKILLDIPKIKIEHVLQHNAKFAQSMLIKNQNQHLFSEMKQEQNFNVSKSVLVNYLQRLKDKQYMNMVPEQQEIFYEVKGQYDERNPYPDH